MKNNVKVIIAIIFIALLTSCSAKKANADSENGKDTGSYAVSTLKDYGITIDYEKENDTIFCEIYIDDTEDYYLSFILELDSDYNEIQALLSRNFRSNESNVYSLHKTGVDVNNRSIVIGVINEIVDMSEEGFRNINNIKNMLTRIIFEL